MARYPEQHLSVFCLCNSTVDTRHLARTIADLVLGVPAGAARDAAALREPFRSLQPAVVAATAGRYLNPRTGTIWSLRPHRGSPAGLALDVWGVEYLLSATPDGVLVFTDPPLGWRVAVERDETGGGARLRLFEEGVETARYDRVGAAPPASRLADYAGVYDSEELDNPYTLRLVDGELLLTTRLQPAGTLLFAGPDRFVLPTEWFTLVFTFSRDAQGRVDGFRLDSGAADGFRLVRRGA
jgi:hypothetical protein